MPDFLEGPYLPALGLAAELSEEDRGTLSSYGEFRFADRGEALIVQGESHGKLVFILSGVLHAIRRDTERDVLLGSIRRGEWVGEVELFDPAGALCSVMVIEPIQYWTITRSNLEEFINHYPKAGTQIVISLAALLSKRLRSVTKRLMEEAELAVVRASFLGTLSPLPGVCRDIPEALNEWPLQCKARMAALPVVRSVVIMATRAATAAANDDFVFGGCPLGVLIMKCISPF
jgi:CRP-like cAMP-binding protein